MVPFLIMAEATLLLAQVARVNDNSPTRVQISIGFEYALFGRICYLLVHSLYVFCSLVCHTTNNTSNSDGRTTQDQKL